MVTCYNCGSENVSCEKEYFSTGGDMEQVEWIHLCIHCGSRQSKIQQGCYGYDNHYNCPFPGCRNVYP
jgi:hypothetical protein